MDSKYAQRCTKFIIKANKYCKSIISWSLECTMKHKLIIGYFINQTGYNLYLSMFTFVFNFNFNF